MLGTEYKAVCLIYVYCIGQGWPSAVEHIYCERAPTLTSIVQEVISSSSNKVMGNAEYYFKEDAAEHLISVELYSPQGKMSMPSIYQYQQFFNYRFFFFTLFLGG